MQQEPTLSAAAVLIKPLMLSQTILMTLISILRVPGGKSNIFEESILSSSSATKDGP